MDKTILKIKKLKKKSNMNIFKTIILIKSHEKCNELNNIKWVNFGLKK